MKERFKGNNYINWGLTLFSVVAASIILVFILLRIDTLIGFITKILTILTPIFIGILFAYLLNPLVKILERYITVPFIESIKKKVFKKLKNKKKISRILAITLTFLIVILSITLFIEFVIPSLLDSLNIMVTSIPSYINDIYNYLKDLLKTSPELMKFLDVINANIKDYIGTLMIPSVDSIMANITIGISSFIKWVANILIGFIVSAYLLYDKDSFTEGTRKFLRSILPDKIYDITMTTFISIDKIFGGFLVAKIIDSLLIGILTFIVISVFKIPYALIISVIVGVTNIIPYFGPFIGAIPCILLLLLIDPTKALYFAILILLIQQFDGNILGPKLIGNRTGIKSFWVLFSILLFGGLFGFVGMIFGVPVFAVIYSVIGNLVNKKLDKKNTL